MTPSGSLFEKAQPAIPAITAHIDGGARGNPGPAGYGVYIQDEAGKTIAEMSEFLGVQTNNVAEYSALVAALEFATKNEHRALRVVSDSELLVKQMTGVYKVKSPDLKELYDRARSLARKLESFQVRHVLRHQNKEADRLANAAMDRGMGRTPVSSAAGPSPAKATKELNGIIRGGVVELLSGDLPEGTLVKVRAKE